MINRTDSILKMTSEKNKNVQKIPINKSNNYEYNKSTIIKPNYLFKEKKKSLFKNNSFSKNLNNPLLNDSANNSIYILPKENIYKNNNITNYHKFIRNKTLQSNNNKYNPTNKNIISYSSRNNTSKDLNYKIRDDLFQNLKQKYKNYTKLYDNSINNGNNSNYCYIQKKGNNEKYENKNYTINNYIFNNLKKINDLKLKKNLKCSVLSNEASKAIKDFNYNLKQKLNGGSQLVYIDKNKYYKLINSNGNTKKNNYNYINRNKKENYYFNYQEEISDYDFDDDLKIEEMPNKINSNRLEVLNNNYYEWNSTKLEKINNYYKNKA